MRKMTLATILVTGLILGIQAPAFSGHANRAGHFPGAKNKGYVRVDQNWKGYQIQRRCQPATIKVWLNGYPTTVQVTTCRKENNWIVSPIYINLGNQAAHQQKRGPRREEPRYGGNFYPNPPYPWFGR